MYIVAEIGINANANLETAYKMMDIAQDAGVDAVKFQTWKKDLYPNIEQFRFDYWDFEQIFSYSHNVGIHCYSTPFDFQSIDFLNNLGMKIWKIPSGKVKNVEYLKYISDINPAKIILSTGLSNLGDVLNAVDILKGCNYITILQCTTQYPAKYDEVNLCAMNVLKKTGYPVGLSDHSIGIEIPFAACAMGAVMLEKHFTLDKRQLGPDHHMSIEPDALKRMVHGIRNIEMAMGQAKKEITAGEAKIFSEIVKRMDEN